MKSKIVSILLSLCLISFGAYAEEGRPSEHGGADPVTDADKTTLVTPATPEQQHNVNHEVHKAQHAKKKKAEDTKKKKKKSKKKKHN